MPAVIPPGLAAVAAPSFAVAADTVDRSPHRQRFIDVHGARLEVLDWGGTGPALVFLPGFGDGGHVFDDLAPRFTDRFHVVAITPRGFPPSSAPDSGYTIEQLADDVAAVLDSLGVGARQAVLAGHSISGAVMTRFAETHGDRLRAAIYIDAAFDFGEVHRASTTRPVGLTGAVDTTTARARAWDRRYGGTSPASEADDRMWQRIDSTDLRRRRALVLPLADEVRGRPHTVWNVRAPALAICPIASVARDYGWLAPDSARWSEVRRYIAQKDSAERAVCDRFRRRLLRGETVEMEGDHYVFLDHPAAVARAMRRFLGRLR
jgi:pimeloyl-ACP methyl ester carboxylesterase